MSSITNGKLQEAAVTAVSGEDIAEPEQEQNQHGSSNNLAGSQSNGDEASEVARFGAAKEKKHSLESGISVFNRSASCAKSCCPGCMFTFKRQKATDM